MTNCNNVWGSQGCEPQTYLLTKSKALWKESYEKDIEEGTQKGNYKKLISNFIWTTGDKGTGGQGDRNILKNGQITINN